MSDIEIKEKTAEVLLEAIRDKNKARAIFNELKSDEKIQVLFELQIELLLMLAGHPLLKF